MCHARKTKSSEATRSEDTSYGTRWQAGNELLDGIEYQCSKKKVFSKTNDFDLAAGEEIGMESKELQ